MCMTALFGAASPVAARLLSHGRCVLEFEQYAQGYRIPCSVAGLAHRHPFYQATYWHNRLFNPHLPDGVQVLSFTPDWTARGGLSDRAGEQVVMPPRGVLAMHPAIADLLAPASFRLSTAEAVLPPFVESAAGPLAGELQALLQVRNGFYAFSNALHVFPSASSDLSWGLEDWNMPGLWKHEYETFVDPGLCFAQDVFANQFSIKGGTIYRFDAETGGLTPVAATVAKWAELIQSNDRLWTGWPIAYRWKEKHGPIPLHQRLRPVTPLCCGGGSEIEDLTAVDAALLLGHWERFATQIHDLPDGATISSAILRGDPPG